MGHSAFPLEWPTGRKRLDSWCRKASRFRDLGFAKCRDDLLRSCKKFGAKNVVLSTEVALRLDGLPYANMRAPNDPGVALYFDLQKYTNNKMTTRHFALACDTYRKVEENLRALVHTIEAMNQIERHGSAELLEQAMSGFAALDAPREGWRKVLGVGTAVTYPEAKLAYRQLVAKHHPDVGGDPLKMEALNLALADAERELGGAS